MNASILAVVEDDQVAGLLDAFREMDAATRMQGSRAAPFGEGPADVYKRQLPDGRTCREIHARRSTPSS